MMKKMAAASLLLALLLATALPLQSQTRPRRVTQVTDTPAGEIIPRRREGPTPRRRGRGWMSVLLGTAISIGTHVDRSCTPSRGVIGERPRVRF